MTQPWTEELDTCLTKLVEDKFSTSEIAALFEMPFNQVKKRIYLLGIYAGGGAVSEANPFGEKAIRAASMRFAREGAALLQQRSAA